MSKNLFISLVFLSIWTGKTLSQNVPFPEKEAVWKEEHITFAGPFLKYFALCGDTIIGGNNYSQVVELQVDSALNIVGKTFQGGLRSGGSVVRYLPVWASMEYVLFDFSLESGDSIDLLPLYSSSPVTRQVDSVRIETLAGKLRKVIYFHPYASETIPEYWIEGIGSSYGLLGRAIPPGGDIGFSLLCFQHGNEYENFTLIECFLPELSGCGLTNDDFETKNRDQPRLTPAPNPAGEAIRFLVQHNGNYEDLTLKIFGTDGQLLRVLDEVTPETPFSYQERLASGMYVAVLLSKKTGQAMAQCTFVLKE